MMVHPLVTTTIASQIHPSSPGSCSHRKSLSLLGHSKEISCRSRNEPESKRESRVCDDGGWKKTSDGVADSVFEVSMVEDPVKVAAEVKLCGKGGGGGGAKS
ncbi:hypothetical protein Bca101_072150 [Brassica carinata]